MTDNNLCYRTAELDHGSGREIYGRAVPYDEVVQINMGGPPYDYMEKFQFGAFARSIRERGHKVKLLTQHDRHKLAVGRAVDLNEQSDGLYVSFEVAQTRDGDELLELVRTGVVDSFSVGFEPVRDRREKDVLVRVEAKLREVSAVNFPAYENAHIAGVRSQLLVIPHAVAERRLRLLEL